MGLEGPRLWTSASDIETLASDFSTEIPATMTDGPADLTARPDSFLLCSMPAGPDALARPAVGHPLFACSTPVIEPSPELALRSFSEELARFESLLENDPEAAAASLDSVECLAERIESLSTDGLSDQALRDRSVAVLQTWSLVRAAVIRIAERTERPSTARLNDTAVTDRMRAAARDVVERVTEIAEPSAVEDFETRLDAAIDDDDREFLAALTPETVSSFLATHEMATALSEFADESEGEDRLTASLESARLFGTLGLEDRVTETLATAEAAVRDLPEESDFLDGFLSIAGVYQEAGMIDEANRTLLQVSFVGENSTDPASRERGAMARAMQLVNHGEFLEAEEIVAALPESEASVSLLEGIREGARRQRVLENLGLYQGYMNLYLETHPLAEGADREALGREFRQALEGAAADALSGETPDLWRALNARTSECPSLASFLFDTEYGRGLEAVSAPDIDRDEFEFRVLTLADRYMDDSDYNAAGIVAQAFREDDELGSHCEEYFRRIEYHTSRESLSRSGANFVGDWLSMMGIGILESAGHFLSTMTFGLSGTGGSIEDDLPGTAEFALLIASEGLSVEADALFSTSRFAEGLSPLARGTARWAVREGTMATVMSGGGLLINAARERSLDGLTLENFGREFGANLVLFSLVHGTGMATRGAPGVVRWGAGVGTFAAADYVNEAIGFREASDHGFGRRLLDSMAGDARVRFASWLGNRMSGGRFERLREESARRAEAHSEAWRASGRRVDISSWARGLVRYLPIPGVGMGGIGFVAGVRRSGGVTRPMGMAPEIGIRSLSGPETLANIGTNSGRFDQLAGLMETLPEYAALNRASSDAAETARIREEVSAELGGRFENMTRVSDALQRVLRRHGIDLIDSRSGLDARIASGEITARDASGLSRLSSHLLYQFYPDGVPLFRSVHSEYAGHPGTMRESGSDWRVGEAAGADGALAYHEDGMVLITTTMGDIRSAGGRFVIDPHAAVMDALTVVHPGGRLMPYEVVGSEGSVPAVVISPIITVGDPARDTIEILPEDRPTMPPPPDMPRFEPRPVAVADGPIARTLPRSATAVGLAVRHANAHLADVTGFRFAIESSVTSPGEAGGAPAEIDIWVAGPEAEGAFLETLRNSSSRVTVETLGGGEYLVRDADRGDSVVTIRHDLELSVAQQTHLGEWLRDVPPSERAGITLTSYSRPRLESLVDHLIGRGWNQAQIEGLFASRGITAEDTAAIVGPRVRRAAGEGRSGEGAL